MAYLIGQYIYTHSDNSDNNFLNRINDISVREHMTYYSIDNTGDNQLQFEDKEVQYSFNKDNVYYYKIAIRRMENSSQEIRLYLSNDSEDKIQYLRTIKIEEQGIGVINFEGLFNPVDSGFTKIIFKLKRNNSDYFSGNNRVIDISSFNLFTCSNLQENNNIPAKLLKIGVQANPGFMMSINKEEIHIGKSGIYEIRTGEVTINQFTPITNGSFILDYMYEG